MLAVLLWLYYGPDPGEYLLYSVRALWGVWPVLFFTELAIASYVCLSAIVPLRHIAKTASETHVRMKFRCRLGGKDESFGLLYAMGILLAILRRANVAKSWFWRRILEQSRAKEKSRVWTGA